MDRLGIAIVVVSLMSVVFVVELVRRRHLREKYAMLWMSVGGLIVILSFFRPVLDRLSEFLGVTYGPSALFLFAILFLVAVAAHLSWEVSRLEERTRRLAEEIALIRVTRPPLDESAERS